MRSTLKQILNHHKLFKNFIDNLEEEGANLHQRAEKLTLKVEDLQQKVEVICEFDQRNGQASIH